ncbi:MAG: class I SAM-dependent methyltransferase [Spirulina sp.]
MSKEYLHKRRIVSYYNQVRIIKSLGKHVKNILEIGIDRSLMSTILERDGYRVTTADIDPDLEPDILLDLSSDFEIPQNTFDVIVLFQVLEHLPYEYFEKNLKKLSDATRQYLVISLPYRSIFLAMQLQSTFLKRNRHLLWQIPEFWKSETLTEQHYWEIGLRGYPKRRIINSFKTVGLNIKYQYQDSFYPYHYFFVLEKST